MTIASDNAGDLTASQLEASRRAVARIRRAAIREVMSEPPMTVQAAVAEWHRLQDSRKSQP